MNTVFQKLPEWKSKVPLNMEELKSEYRQDTIRLSCKQIPIKTRDTREANIKLK